MSNNTLENSKTREAEIQQVLESLMQAWNAADSDAYCAHYTPDADHVVWNGMRIKGREAITAGHARILSTIYAGSKLHMKSFAMRFLGEDIALVDCDAKLLPESEEDEPYQLETRPLCVFHRQVDGRWMIEAFHNTPVMPEAMSVSQSD